MAVCSGKPSSTGDFCRQPRTRTLACFSSGVSFQIIRNGWKKPIVWVGETQGILLKSASIGGGCITKQAQIAQKKILFFPDPP